MILPEYVAKIREDVRYLRIHSEQLKRSWQLQKKKAEDLEKENNKLRKENDALKQKEQELLEELEKIKRERDTYKNLVFKPKQQRTSPFATVSGKKRGGRVGHKGYGRQLSEQIDHTVRTYLSHCPECDQKLSRVEAVKKHTVVDVPHWGEIHPITTQYEIERQWCTRCKKEVKATPLGVFPFSRLGNNLFTMVCAWHYRFNDPLNKIVERLRTHYALHISEGSLVLILQRAKRILGPKYDEFLAEIRGSPVKHGDETSWKVAGKTWWAWVGVSAKSVVYTIEESRGKGVAEDLFSDAVGVLVRDDYGGYTKLPLLQQSCWAHLLRVSHNLAVREEASEEVKQLNKKLKTVFLLLAEDVASPFEKRERTELHQEYVEDLRKIIHTPYTAKDSLAVQTRVRNQQNTLLTALLYPGVPLTNNAAERAVLPLVIQRKISRDSKTPQGACTRAINMSIVQTIAKRNLPLLDTLQEYLTNSSSV